MAKLRELLKATEVLGIQGDPGVEIAGIAYDSRKVQPGDLFVCIKGFRFDGHDFAPEAIRRGAGAILAGREVGVTPGVALVRVPNTRIALGQVASEFYGHPSHHMRLIGIIGTKGKTTTTYLVKSILEAAGHKVGLIGTIQNMIGSTVLPAERTTPESLDLQALLATMRREGAQYVVMEVSSHAVELYRTAGAVFDVGVFTNITHDHLDFHENFENYLTAKTRFFTRLSETTLPAGNTLKQRRAAVINADDPHSGYIIERTSVPVLRYGIKEQADFQAREVAVHLRGSEFTARTPAGEIRLHLNLTGRFNVANALAALAVAHHENVGLAAARAGLEGLAGVPGRFETVDLGQDFAVIVDYAHTPDSLEKTLQAARPLTPGKITVVFGCGGDRDKAKRPIMGRVAAELADYVVVTSDNPRSEPPEAICRDVEAGVTTNGGPRGGYAVIVDRREAIEHAIARAGKEDMVLIAGKGHEPYQVFRDRTIHFSDREVASEILKQLDKAKLG